MFQTTNQSMVLGYRHFPKDPEKKSEIKSFQDQDIAQISMILAAKMPIHTIPQNSPENHSC
jgi:hypothetical protein